MVTIEEALASASQLWKAGQLEEAEVLCHSILNFDPEHTKTHGLLAAISLDQKRFGMASLLAESAIASSKDEISYYMTLGKSSMEMSFGISGGRAETAVKAFNEAIRLSPDDAELYDWLGLAYHASGQLELAVRAYRQALLLIPDFMGANGNLACALMQLGRLDEAMHFHHRAVELGPGNLIANDNLLLCSHYQPGVTLEGILELHKAWYHRVIEPMSIPLPEHPNSKGNDKRLKVGFVSYDFGRHPVGYFLLQLLRNISDTEIETVCYSDRITADDMTEKLREAAHAWHDTSALTHLELAQKIFDDGVDILIDLAGHTAKSRLIVFAYKPAPVQMAWAGYVGTTGLKEMDYLIADSYHVPLGTEVRFSEDILRLPDIWVSCYPPDGAPPVAALPAIKSGRITFASFSIPTKIHAQTIEIWSEILAKVPDSRLLLMYKGMDDPSNVGRILKAFSAHGIAVERIEMRGPSDHVKLLHCYAQEVDIALDTFPYSGGLTTCEALWMGVPVITCPGETFASRHSYAFLSVVGLGQFAATSLNDYVDRAVALAGNLTQLTDIRAGLRDRIKASPLSDGPRFATNFTHLLRVAWKKWCSETSNFEHT